MFESIIYNNHVENLYEFVITDSDFYTSIFIKELGDAEYLICEYGAAVIQTYEKRNLSVPLNLILAAKYLNFHYECSFEEIFSCWRRYTPEYNKYEEDMQKYLVLI